LDITDNKIDLANVYLDHTLKTLKEVIKSLKVDLVSFYKIKEHLEYAISSLNTAKDYLQINTISISNNLDFAKSHIEFAQYNLNYDITAFLGLLFTRLEAKVKSAPIISANPRFL
jgi:hypothetical protein